MGSQEASFNLTFWLKSNWNILTIVKIVVFVKSVTMAKKMKKEKYKLQFTNNSIKL